MIEIVKEVGIQDFINFIYDGFDPDDPKLYKNLNSGKAINVFQMSAGTASQVVEQIKPNNLSELTACNAFARPGTISGVPNYVDGKSGKLKYQNPIINSVLGETFGVCLYQESIMKLFVTIVTSESENKNYGNYIRSLLKKLGKANKKQEDVDAWKRETEKFAQGATELKISQNEVKALLEDVAALANYSFNKSHALAYSMMAAFTLYLNVYFSNFYYPAVIEYAFAHEKETLDTLKTMRKNGFNIVEPNLISSKDRTYSDGNNIYIGLHNLKQVGNAATDICVNSPYSSFADFLNKNLKNSLVNKRAVTALVEFGCFDELEPELTRQQMIGGFRVFWENKSSFRKVTPAQAKKLSESELMEKLAKIVEEDINKNIEYWNDVKKQILSNQFVPDVSRQFLKECELKYLGFNFFVTPFDNDIGKFISEKINKGLCIDGFSTLRKYKDISKVVPVYISSARIYNDKNGNEMCFLKLEDRFGEEISVPVFASNYEFVKDKIGSDIIALILMYNTDDLYHGGEQIMIGTKKRVQPEKFSSFIIPIRSVK